MFQMLVYVCVCYPRHKTRLYIGQLVKDTAAKLREASETDHQRGVNVSCLYASFSGI